MEFDAVDEAVELLEKANADLQPELLDRAASRRMLEAYSRARKLADFGVAALARKLNDAAEVARTTGTSLGDAKDAVSTGKTLQACGELKDALRRGEVSLDQASQIATAEESCPGAAAQLLRVAREEAFCVLKDKARKTKLEAEQHRGLARRQAEARCARSYGDELGMVHVHLALQPHVAAPIVRRAESVAASLQRAAKRDDAAEPFERHLADAYAHVLTGAAAGKARRPEVVILVSQEVAKRGWVDVKHGEFCKIPGIGPVAPQSAREIAQDAFLTGVFYDGTDLRHMRRWTRNIPAEVRLALELGSPPDFDGVRCVDCGNRFRTENDHVQPHCALGPASTDNLQARCWGCHKAKTERDRKAGKLTPPET